MMQVLHRWECKMSAQLDQLGEQVRKNTDLNQSAIVLIRGLSQQIKDAKDDPVKLAQLAADLDRSAQDLGSAINENTPAATEAPTAA